MSYNHEATAEAPLLRIKELEGQVAMLREALEAECGDRCNAEYNPCPARVALTSTSSDWLRKHDAEVLRKKGANV